jgi:hypothetical protein
VEVHVRPEPTPEERKILMRIVRELSAPPARGYGSRWRLSGFESDDAADWRPAAWDGRARASTTRAAESAARTSRRRA